MKVGLLAAFFLLSMLVSTPPSTTQPATPTPTITPTPTAIRVIDLAVGVDDSVDPVMPGQVFHYVVEGEKIEPLSVVAPNVSMWGELAPAGSVRFTGTYSVTHNPNLQCYVESASFLCYAQYDPGTVHLEAVVGSSAAAGPLSLCATIAFTPLMGGGDPNPDNNQDCAETALWAPTLRNYLPLIAR